MRGHGIEKKKSLEGGAEHEQRMRILLLKMSDFSTYYCSLQAYPHPVLYSAISGLSYRKEIVLSLRVLTQILRTELF